MLEKLMNESQSQASSTLFSELLGDVFPFPAENPLLNVFPGDYFAIVSACLFLFPEQSFDKHFLGILKNE